MKTKFFDLNRAFLLVAAIAWVAIAIGDFHVASAGVGLRSAFIAFLFLVCAGIDYLRDDIDRLNDEIIAMMRERIRHLEDRRIKNEASRGH